MYSGYFDFITLFVGMTTPFYAIKLDVVNLLLDLFFLFLATLNLYLNLMYSTNFIITKSLYMSVLLYLVELGLKTQSSFNTKPT